MVVGEGDDGIVDLAGRFDAHRDDPLHIRASGGVAEPPQVERGDGVLIQRPRLGGGAAHFWHELLYRPPTQAPGATIAGRAGPSPTAKYSARPP
jgi:hypothetical protein